MIKWFELAPPVPWHELAPPVCKDKRMPMTEDYFYRVLAMDAELIDEMRKEIQQLKMTINKLRQKSTGLVISPIDKIK
jgi:hypothetical protein|tara:strand:+ start:979 stop:1212 length:234 start_codon:yes stop_codon:yes gene_type:complete